MKIEYIYGVGLLNSKHGIYRVKKSVAMPLIDKVVNSSDSTGVQVEIEDMPRFNGKRLVVAMSDYNETALNNIQSETPFEIDGDGYELSIMFDQTAARQTMQIQQPSQRGPIRADNRGL